jgi:hypothetical protein
MATKTSIPQAAPQKTPISKESETPPFEPTAPISPNVPPAPGWAPGGFDLPTPDLPSHIDVQNNKRR